MPAVPCASCCFVFRPGSCRTVAGSVFDVQLADRPSAGQLIQAGPKTQWFKIQRLAPLSILQAIGQSDRWPDKERGDPRDQKEQF